MRQFTSGVWAVVWCVCLLARSPFAEAANVLKVGIGQDFVTAAIAADYVRDGDTVEIAPGDYHGDVAVWRANDLTIRGVGGRPHIMADGRNAEGKAIWVIKGSNVTVENIEFSGASVRDHNGAAIRAEGTNLTIRRCYFHDNENGILQGGQASESVISIERSEFARNGHGEGRTHNIYIGAIKELVLRFNYIHHARVGHNVKSRARTTRLLYNRIGDDGDGNSSYLVDLPNGGMAYLIGNVLQQGPRTENYTMVAYGAEGIQHKKNGLFMVNNTLINDREQGGIFVKAAQPVQGRIINNIFWGHGDFSGEPGAFSHNLKMERGGLWDRWFGHSPPVFRNPQGFDYHLVKGSQAIDAGQDPGSIDGFDLSPGYEYMHPADGRPRKVTGPLDLGAFEYSGDQ